MVTNFRNGLIPVVVVVAAGEKGTVVGNFPDELFKVAGSFEDPFLQWNPPGRWHWLKRFLAPNLRHRTWVGGTAGSDLEFRESCRFQLNFLIEQGLQPDSTLLDLGCGCLRGGIHFIDYLQPEKYLGLDISAEVVRRGIVKELGMSCFQLKKPEFVVTNEFDFTLFSKPPEIVFANSLFTHLPKGDVVECLNRLRTFAPNCSLFATFSEVEKTGEHDGIGHYVGGTNALTYTRAEMESIGEECGWATKYIGPWGHPKNEDSGDVRRQMMFRFGAS